ncbi:MAG TPA: metal-dependent hydrolase [Noviherbaspirillum sp.]|jgi:inner membrane protein|uniref:metal-dependent hydrolase n=1 Tax=Noviherbaspirillum sp. TaxID=1926288 RepID=UPI002F93669D
MDNLSHTVAGLAAGELLHRILAPETKPEDTRTRHRLLLTTAALASNFPDLDLVLTPLLPAPLGYLLHHRGHTHTIVYALPQMLLLASVLLACWRSARQLVMHSRSARAGFLIALAAGFSLHLAMDYLNSYGLHPFHPFDSRWRYGDMVFILEPMFWVTLGLPMALMIPRRTLRILLILLLLGVPLYFTLQSYLVWFSLLGLYAVAALLSVAHCRTRRGVTVAAGMLVIFIGGQAAASYEAERGVREVLLAQHRGTRVHDIALTAFPANPLCWAFASVDSDEEQGVYRLNRGIASIAPGVLPAKDCPASLNPARNAVPGGVIIIGTAHGSLAELRDMKRENCFFDAWLRFARIPLLVNNEAIDLRFASTPNGNFTAIQLQDLRSEACPETVPRWDYPRRDLIDRAPPPGDA